MQVNRQEKSSDVSPAKIASAISSELTTSYLPIESFVKGYVVDPIDCANSPSAQSILRKSAALGLRLQLIDVQDQGGKPVGIFQIVKSVKDSEGQLISSKVGECFSIAREGENYYRQRDLTFLIELDSRVKILQDQASKSLSNEPPRQTELEWQKISLPRHPREHFHIDGQGGRYRFIEYASLPPDREKDKIPVGPFYENFWRVSPLTPNFSETEQSVFDQFVKKEIAKSENSDLLKKHKINDVTKLSVEQAVNLSTDLVARNMEYSYLQAALDVDAGTRTLLHKFSFGYIDPNISIDNKFLKLLPEETQKKVLADPATAWRSISHLDTIPANLLLKNEQKGVCRNYAPAFYFTFHALKNLQGPDSQLKNVYPGIMTSSGVSGAQVGSECIAGNHAWNTICQVNRQGMDIAIVDPTWADNGSVADITCLDLTEERFLVGVRELERFGVINEEQKVKQLTKYLSETKKPLSFLVKSAIQEEIAKYHLLTRGDEESALPYLRPEHLERFLVDKLITPETSRRLTGAAVLSATAKADPEYRAAWRGEHCFNEGRTVKSGLYFSNYLLHCEDDLRVKLRYACVRCDLNSPDALELANEMLERRDELASNLPPGTWGKHLARLRRYVTACNSQRAGGMPSTTVQPSRTYAVLESEDN